MNSIKKSLLIWIAIGVVFTLGLMLYYFGDIPIIH